jgi:hypothetical protein
MGIDAASTPRSFLQVGGTLGPEDVKRLANRIRAGNVNSVDIANAGGVDSDFIGRLLEAAAAAPTDTLVHLRVDAPEETPFDSGDITKILCTSLPPLMRIHNRANHTITIAIGGVAVAAVGPARSKLDMIIDTVRSPVFKVDLCVADTGGNPIEPPQTLVGEIDPDMEKFLDAVEAIR